MFGKHKFQFLVISVALVFGLAGIILLRRHVLEERRTTRLASLSSDCREIAARQDWKSLEVAASEWVELDDCGVDRLLASRVAVTDVG